MSESTIDVEAAPSQAVAVRQEGGAVGRALTIDELHRNLEYVREVMRKEMKKGVDYGQIPGCGDKPGLFQPGAQKLLMTFNLSEYVKKEVLRDYPGFHREYEFTVTVKAPNGKEWDGVGTCSTLEGKYRYRKAERKCPKCGHATIIAENPKFLKPGQVAGWLCWKKKGGCGATFGQKDPAIASQRADKTENPDPAECWNTVRKMAFKRALVAAAINATNTSELWTQDLEDMRPNGSGEADDSPPSNLSTPPGKASPRPASARPEAQKPASTAKIAFPTPDSRAKMIAALNAGPGQPDRVTVEDYFRKLENPAQLMPGEALEDLPLRFVPATKKQMCDLHDRIQHFASGDPAAAAFPPHPEPDQAPKAAPKGGGGQAPPPSTSTSQPKSVDHTGLDRITGVIQHVSQKHGTGNNGPWVLYGIKICDGWINTFSDTLGSLATEHKGKQVTVWYKQEEKGRTAQDLQPGFPSSEPASLPEPPAEEVDDVPF